MAVRPVADVDADVDIAQAYELIVRIRRFEEAQARLWAEGLISGELHTGIGEEAVAVGVVSALRADDALALDHRGTPALIARGVDPVALLLEAVGSERGLCHGHAGHMHLCAPEFLAVADGIVGSSAATACGFAVAARRLRPGSVAVAFFGEGATNQGILLEAWNLATAWRLPVLFVCKDNDWSITTRSRDVTGGSLLHRARSFGMPARAVDGWKVIAVATAARRFLRRARAGGGPAFLLARVHRPDGHYAGDPLLRMLRSPAEARELTPGLAAAAIARPGAPGWVRAQAAGVLARRMATLGWQYALRHRDPVPAARRLVAPELAEIIDARVEAELVAVVDEVRSVLGVAPPLAGVR